MERHGAGIESVRDGVGEEDQRGEKDIFFERICIFLAEGIKSSPEAVLESALLVLSFQ